MTAQCPAGIIPHLHLEPPGASCVGLTPGMTGIKWLPVDGCPDIFFLVLIFSALGSYLQSL